MISLVITVALVGLLLWAVTTFWPMDPKVVLLLRALVVALLFLYCLQVLGIWNSGLRFWELHACNPLTRRCQTHALSYRRGRFWPC